VGSFSKGRFRPGDLLVLCWDKPVKKVGFTGLKPRERNVVLMLSIAVETPKGRSKGRQENVWKRSVVKPKHRAPLQDRGLPWGEPRHVQGKGGKYKGEAGGGGRRDCQRKKCGRRIAQHPSAASRMSHKQSVRKGGLSSGARLW